MKPTGEFSGVLRKRAPWYWRLTQGREFLLSYLRGYIQTMSALLVGRLTHAVVITSETRGEFYDHRTGITTDYGVTSRRVVTDAFVAYIVDALDTAQASFDDFDYGGFGSGTNAEAVGDTALQTEFTTQYATDNVRPTGTVSQPAANQFRIVVIFAPDTACTVNEFGVFNQAAVGGGTLMDRGLTGEKAMVSGDTYTVTYTLTISSGG